MNVRTRQILRLEYRKNNSVQVLIQFQNYIRMLHQVAKKRIRSEKILRNEHTRMRGNLKLKGANTSQWNKTKYTHVSLYHIVEIFL